MGAYPLAPPHLWSQVVDQLPGYGATASSGGITSPSTTAAGMPGYVPPPPGLPPIDFSNWRLPHPEAQASRGLPTAPPGLPGVGRSIRLRGMAKRIVGAQMVQCPGGLAQWTLTPPTSMPCLPKWHRLSANHHQSSWPCHISRWYKCHRSPQGGESLPKPPQIKPPLWVAQVHRTMEDLTQESREAVQNASCRFSSCKLCMEGFPVSLQFCLYYLSKACAGLGNCCEWLRVKIFVRVLRSSRVNLSNVNDTNVFCCVWIKSSQFCVTKAVLVTKCIFS